MSTAEKPCHDQHEHKAAQPDRYTDGTDHRIIMETEGAEGVFDYLAKLPADTILAEAALARAFGVTTRTIRRMVERFELPPPFRHAGRSCWFSGKVLEWIHASAERSAKKTELLAKRFWD